MNCDITCTRKTTDILKRWISNVATFEKLRENSTGEKVREKKVRVKSTGKRNTGKKYGEIVRKKKSTRKKVRRKTIWDEKVQEKSTGKKSTGKKYGGKFTWLPVTSLLVKHAHGITSDCSPLLPANIRIFSRNFFPVLFHIILFLFSRTLSYFFPVFFIYFFTMLIFPLGYMAAAAVTAAIYTRVEAAAILRGKISTGTKKKKEGEIWKNTGK